MLITCPECKLQVSDKAYACPHCGYPMREQKNESMPASVPGLVPRQAAAPGPGSTVQAAQVRTNRPASRSHSRRKHRRLPNGFGQISYLKNQNLRKPYRAMITVGKDENGRPICRLLKPEAYFRTYNEAYEALLKYHHSPYDLSKASMTMSELFDEWFQKYSETVSKGTARNVKSLWGFCEMIYDISVIELKTHDVKKCLEEGTRTLRNGKTKAITAVNKRKAKTLISMLLDYAISDIPEDVYTQRNESWLRTEIKKLNKHVRQNGKFK
ncbi:MAG: hypothetical protein ACOYJJ_04525 [Anaerovoracaceae bacterium]|jgi:hypothetical protein